MTTRYQKEHYEDVAGLLRATQGKFDEEEAAVVGTLAYSFAILFAADNPAVCPKCGRESLDDDETNESIYEETKSKYVGSTASCVYGCGSFTLTADNPNFNREQFLTACGLESGG